MSTYPEYKYSGLPWLGKVPAHWELTTIGSISSRRSARNRTDLPLLSVLREKGVVLRSSLGEDENHNFVPDDLSNYRVAIAGDLVVNKMKAWQGSVGIAPCDGIVSPAYFVFELLKITQPYAHRLFRSKPYVAFFAHASDGVRIGQWDLSIDRMKRIPVPIPPPAEQAGIVRFLGAVDRRVNRFVRAKRRLIELLTEQKQAIITHAVTRGLNPNAKLKPSGMPWLGDVPEHWKIVTLRRLATKFGSGVTPRGGATVYRDEGVPFLRSQNVQFDGLRLDGVARIAPKLHASLSGTHVQPGDVLLNITGASIGRVCAVPANFAEGNVSQHVCIIRPRLDRIRPDFLAAYLSTSFMQREIYIEQNGASREGLALGAIRAFKILLPPPDEQLLILNFVRASTAEVIATSDVARREIELIREYRTRLVADVVTGKLDVRDAAARLPLDEAEGSEPVEADEDEVGEEAIDAEAAGEEVAVGEG